MEHRICVSLGRISRRELASALRRFDLVEIRLDLLGLAQDEIGDLFCRHRRAVATCRPGGALGEKERLKLLGLAVRAGAAFVDIELETAPVAARRLVRLARRLGCRVIVSHHDHEKTPARRRLEEIRRACFRRGADLAKIACRVRRPGEAARLLGLLDGRRPTLVSGLGEHGLPVRVLAPLLGAPFTYASPAPGKETAAGQPDFDSLRRLWRFLSRSI